MRIEQLKIVEISLVRNLHIRLLLIVKSAMHIIEMIVGIMEGVGDIRKDMEVVIIIHLLEIEILIGLLEIGVGTELMVIVLGEVGVGKAEVVMEEAIVEIRVGMTEEDLKEAEIGNVEEVIPALGVIVLKLEIQGMGVPEIDELRLDF